MAPLLTTDGPLEERRFFRPPSLLAQRPMTGPPAATSGSWLERTPVFQPGRMGSAIVALLIVAHLAFALVFHSIHIDAAYFRGWIGLGLAAPLLLTGYLVLGPGQSVSRAPDVIALACLRDRLRLRPPLASRRTKRPWVPDQSVREEGVDHPPRVAPRPARRSADARGKHLDPYDKLVENRSDAGKPCSMPRRAFQCVTRIAIARHPMGSPGVSRAKAGWRSRQAR